MWRRVVIIVVAVAAAGVVLAQQPVDEPLDIGLREEVDVQLVLVDFLVLDRHDRTVPGLQLDDFTLLVDGNRVGIASLDLDCPVGAAPDPQSRQGRKAREDGQRPPPPTRPRRIVLVFDHDHMDNGVEAYDAALEMLDELPTEGDEHMLVSMGEVVRVETPFTTDLDEMRWALRRMRNDRDLYAGNHARLTDHRFFERLRALFDILQRWDGRKTIVLLSGPTPSDGFLHDSEYQELSALATIARTAVYPVDTGGIRFGGQLGGPPMLARLANETGGRMTQMTNDISLAYAKAQRDTGCSYTLGFYEPNQQLDRARRLSVRVRGKGLRVVYPDFFVTRSREERRKSLLATASLAPHMFDSDQMRSERFVVAASSIDRWSAVFAVEIRFDAVDLIGEGEEWELKGFLRKPRGTVVRKFKRRVPVPDFDSASGESAVVTLFEEISAPPGEYAFSAVLADPNGRQPRATTGLVSLPQVPRHGPFVLGPFLGRSSPATGEFEPVLDPAAGGDRALESLTVLCVSGGTPAGDRSSLARTVATLDGDEVYRFGDVPVALPGGDGVRCRRVVDSLDALGLPPGRYEISAVARSPSFVTEAETAEFTLGSGPVEPGGTAR